MAEIRGFDPDGAAWPDNGDAALDAALAAADTGMLTAVSSNLDLDAGLAQILQKVKDLAGPSVSCPAMAQEEPTEENRSGLGEISLRDPQSRVCSQVPADAGEVIAVGGGDADLVLAVIETRSACVTLSRLVVDSELATTLVSVDVGMSQAGATLRRAWRRYELILVSVTLVRTSKTIRVIAATITRILVEAISIWEQAAELLRQADRIGIKLAEVHWRLGSLPETSGIYSEVREVINSVGYSALGADGVADALQHARKLALVLGQSRACSFRRAPVIDSSVSALAGGFKLHRTRDLIEILTAEINDICARTGKLTAALTGCAGRIPLDQLAAVQLDASGADLSEADFPDLDVLDGVIWTPETMWPPGVAHGVRSRSREIRPGVYQIQGGSERDPARLAIV